MVGWTAPSATTATTVRLEQRQRKSALPPHAQRVQQEEHQKEKETQLAAHVLLENLKIRTQTMKIFARNVNQDSSLTALTCQSARHVQQGEHQKEQETQLAAIVLLENLKTRIQTMK